jgi:hypothetical protein
METNLVRHILLCKFSPATTPEQFADCITRFQALTTKIDGILGFEYGANNSPEGLDRGMTHIITLSFASVAARDAYLPHPEHVKFAQWLGGSKLLDDLIVVDYLACSQ